ncbi:MAG: Kelch repeat type 1-containing protein [Verrucomicrobia bacterium]|nr:Kelch repeat type 1-containing protein [Verrucomicrobiota bacterium]
MKSNASSKLAALVVAGTVSGYAGTWQALEPLPAPNGGMVCGAADGKILVIGGTNWETDPKKNWLDTVQRFDPATQRWTLAGRLKQPLAYGTGATLGSSFVVVGGSTGAGPFAGVVRCENGKITDQPAGGVSTPAVLSAGGGIGDEIIVVGGSDDAANLKGFSTKACAWNVRTGQVRVLAPIPGEDFGTAASAVIGGDVYVFGGVTWDAKKEGVRNLARAWVYSSAGNRWRELKALPQALRGTAAAVLNDRYIYLGGGFAENDFVDQGLVYDIQADRYLPSRPLPYKSAPHLVREGDFVYCLGGEDRIKHRSNAAYRIKASDLLP